MVAVLAGVTRGSNRTSLDFLPLGVLTPEQQHAYRTAVARVRSLALTCRGEYSRHGGVHRATEKPMGSFLVIPVEKRRAPVAEGFRLHLQRAAELTFPPDEKLSPAALPSDTRCAVETLVAWGTRAGSRRERSMTALRRVADDLRPISVAVNARMGSSVTMVAANVNSAFMAALVDALEWLDTTITRRFVEGFPIVGDIPDSGVYRPIQAADPAEHAEKLRAFRDTAGAWNANLMKRLARGSDNEADDAVALKTQSEHSKGLVVGPYGSVGALVQRMRAMFPHTLATPRLMKRFGIAQKGSIRAIDDARSNGANGATRMHETVATPSFAYPREEARTCKVGKRVLPPDDRPPRSRVF